MTNGNVSYSVHNEKDAAEVEMNCNSGNVSDHISDPFDAIPEKGFECELAVQDTDDFTKVALGRVFKTTSQASVCHGKKIGAETFRVCIYVLMEGKDDTPLPIPTEEFATVGDALGSFVLWPKNGITLRYVKECQKNLESERGEKTGEKMGEQTGEKITEKTATTPKPKRRKTSGTSNSQKVESGKSKISGGGSVTRSNNQLKALLDQNYDCRRLLTRVVSVMRDNQVTDVNLIENVLGSKKRLRLAKEDIASLLNMNKISLGVIDTFLGYVYYNYCISLFSFALVIQSATSTVLVIQTATSTATTSSTWIASVTKEMYGFLCLEIISQIGYASDKAVTILSKRMKDLKRKFYITPYYDE
ncbi:uncharacterized protein LOC141588523 [Silene latifolia]|uniref:uncharacterized protein LOC141588523 n=1 Tax=Silene latifolia TaxID=37657 RepID=UPI003D77924E